MEIAYLGHSSFRLSGKTSRVVTDPFDPKMVGLPFPKTTASIVTVSHQHEDHNKVELVGGDPLVLTIPGEYERGGVRVAGFEVYHDGQKGKERGATIMFRIEIDDITILHCGDLGQQISTEIIEEIGDVDVLLIPTGGIYTISPEEAKDVVSEIEPSIVIPMHYKAPGMSSAFEKLSPVDAFITALGATPTYVEGKLRVVKEELGEETKVIVMKA